MAMLCISRTPTAYSLTQLDTVPSFKDSKEACPDKPVIDVLSCRLPMISFAARPGVHKKRIRSFGDLQVVPDLDDDR